MRVYMCLAAIQFQPAEYPPEEARDDFVARFMRDGLPWSVRKAISGDRDERQRLANLNSRNTTFIT